jgi:hypothetical protein
MVMKTLRYAVRTLAVTVLASGTLVAQAEAVPVVTISTTTPIVTVGDPISIAVEVILAPGDEVGFFDVDVAFSAALVAAGLSSIDPLNAMETPPDPPFDRTIFADVFFPLFYDGAVDVGHPVGGEAAVEAHQGAGFRLVDLTFTATAVGLADFLLTQADIVSFDGLTWTDASAESTTVTILPVAVPEPATMLIVGTGVVAFAARRRIRRRSA